LLGAAFFVLLACNLGIARRMKISSLGVLAALNVFALIMSYVTRFPGFFKRVFVPHWPAVVAGYVMIALLAGWAIRQWWKRKETERI